MAPSLRLFSVVPGPLSFLYDLCLYLSIYAIVATWCNLPSGLIDKENIVTGCEFVSWTFATSHPCIKLSILEIAGILPTLSFARCLRERLDDYGWLGNKPALKLQGWGPEALSRSIHCPPWRWYLTAIASSLPKPLISSVSHRSPVEDERTILTTRHIEEKQMTWSPYQVIWKLW